MLAFLAASAAVVVIGAGCSSAAGTAGTSAGAVNAANGVRFAQCMRSNGVPNFPDPGPSGQLTIDSVANGSGVDPNSAAFQQALSACRTLEPAGFTGTARSAQQQQAALQFAQCVRSNGVADFPDPTPDSPLVDTTRIPSASTASGKSALRAAMQKCSSLSTAAGVTGGR